MQYHLFSIVGYGKALEASCAHFLNFEDVRAIGSIFAILPLKEIRFLCLTVKDRYDLIVGRSLDRGGAHMQRGTQYGCSRRFRLLLKLFHVDFSR